MKLALHRRPVERSTLPEWHRPATARRSHSVGGLSVRGFARGPERSRLLVNLDRLPSGSGLPGAERPQSCPRALG